MVHQLDKMAFVCVSTLLLIAALWRGRARRERRSSSAASPAGSTGDKATNAAWWIARPLVPGLVVMVLAASGGVAVWRGQAIDADLREQMLFQTTAIARQINVEWVRELTFTLDDRSNPAFTRLHQQMKA